VGWAKLQPFTSSFFYELSTAKIIKIRLLFTELFRKIKVAYVFWDMMSMCGPGVCHIAVLFAAEVRESERRACWSHISQMLHNKHPDSCLVCTAGLLNPPPFCKWQTLCNRCSKNVLQQFCVLFLSDRHAEGAAAFSKKIIWSEKIDQIYSKATLFLKAFCKQSVCYE